LKEGDDGYQANEIDFFEKGTHLAITGIKRGDMFLPKVYKRTGIHEILKIIVEGDQFVKFMAKAS